MATITIITNNLLEKKVIANGGRPFIVPDPLPQPPDVPVMEVKGEFVVLVVCSFRDDEPVSEILQAAVTLPTRYRFYFTGNFKRADIVPSAYPEITFLGYVNEEEYWGYMKACNVVMDLTKRDDCLVCGAYESIASLKPVILKDSKVNKDLFRAGCVYTSLSPEAIARSVIHCDTDYNHLLHDVKQFNSEYKQEWVRCKQELFAAIEREKLN
jgi:glycosyltransferase involved in cell wall biosynthesis